MVTTVKEPTDRAKAWKCVRFDDKKGFRTKFNKTNFQDESRREMYYYSVKCVEHGMRGFSPTFVATKMKFEKFRKVSEGLELKPVPEGFQSLSPKKKRETVEKLVDEFGDELAAAMSRAGPVQVNNPGQIQVDEVPAAAPIPDLGNASSNDASLQNVALNQCDNSQGRYPVLVKDLLSFLSDISRRASRYPGRLPEFEFKEEAFRSFINRLEDLEGALEDSSIPKSKSHQEEVYAKLEDLPDEDLQNVTRMPSMESLADEIWSNLLTSPGRPEDPGSSPNLFTG